MEFRRVLFRSKFLNASRRVEQALLLIKHHDPVRYARLLRDMERIWVDLLFGSWGQYRHRLKMCVLDERFVLADTTTPEQIASTIVHEATHARLMNCGIAYEPERRARVEAACFRRERAFADKLPNSEVVKEDAERSLTGYPPDYWTDESRRKRAEDSFADVMRYLGAPDFLIRGVVGVHAAVGGLKRALRRRER